MVRPKRSTKKVDYTQFGDLDGPNDVGSDNDADVVMDFTEEQHESEDDIIQPDSEEEEDNAPVKEGIDEELHDLVKPKKSKGKKKKEKPVVNRVKPVKREITKLKDISSIKDKFLRFFGSNNEKLLELAQLRQKWETATANFNKSQLIMDHVPLPPSINIPETLYTPLSKDEFVQKFPQDSNAINFQFDNNDVLKFSKQDIVQNDGTLVINSGCLVTDLVWSSGSTNSNNTQTLVVGVSNITSNITSENFKLLERHSYPSAIQIYQVDVNTKQAKLVKTLFHNWGNIWDLKIVPIESNDGLISAVFNDGNLRIIKLDNSSNQYLEIQQPSFEFSLSEHMISSYDWIEDYRLVCGTDTGHIAEFSIADGCNTPSYLHPLHSSYVYSVSAAVSKYDETLVYSLCADGVATIFSANDIISTTNKVSRSKVISKTVIYCPSLYSFIQTEGSYSTKCLTTRAAFATFPVTKHDGSTESLASSTLHPFILSGGADGKIKATNLSRRQLAGPKQASSAHKVLTLFELQYGQNEGIYRLLKPLDVEKMSAKDPSTVNIYPPQVSINSLSWNNQQIAGNWFAASSTSGLIIIHEF